MNILAGVLRRNPSLVAYSPRLESHIVYFFPITDTARSIQHGLTYKFAITYADCIPGSFMEYQIFLSCGVIISTENRSKYRHTKLFGSTEVSL